MSAAGIRKSRRHRKQRTLEHEHGRIFLPVPLPYQGLYTDDDSLEQPSALKVYPTTTTPGAEVDTRPQAKLYAQLERNIY